MRLTFHFVMAFFFLFNLTAQGKEPQKLEQPEIAQPFQVDNLPPILSTGWILQHTERKEKIIPFLQLPGWEATYQRPTADGVDPLGERPPSGVGWTLTVQILDCPDEQLGKDAWRSLTELSGLPPRSCSFSYPGARQIDVRQGSRSSPAASSRAAAITEYRSCVWFPPYILFFSSQNAAHGQQELQEVLDALPRD